MKRFSLEDAVVMYGRESHGLFTISLNEIMTATGKYGYRSGAERSEDLSVIYGAVESLGYTFIASSTFPSKRGDSTETFATFRRKPE
ncbi:hypothetical protein AHIS1_p067 [Acaryochloris phage A-HIS1]|nr:hypothetical protein AHIS1_p067 [Acaryochloris phage A-HIS1]